MKLASPLTGVLILINELSLVFHKHTPRRRLVVWMSEHPVVPEVSELKELTQLLLNLLEAAQRLPEGAERQSAFGKIADFQRRLATIIRRSGFQMT